MNGLTSAQVGQSCTCVHVRRGGGWAAGGKGAEGPSSEAAWRTRPIPQDTDRPNWQPLALHPGPRPCPRRAAALLQAGLCFYFLRPIWAIRSALAAALACRFLALAMLKRMFMIFVGTSRDSVNLVRRSLLALSGYSLPLG